MPPMPSRYDNPLFLAVDIAPPQGAPAAGEADELRRITAQVERLAPHLGGIKLGMAFFYAFGAEGVRRMRELGLPIFLDLKLHDIPVTVAAGVRSLAALRPELLTIHAGGGIPMMEAAREAAGQADAPPRLVAVGLLTSLAAEDLTREGIAQTAAERAERLAANALAAGLDALVCAPPELGLLRRKGGQEVLLVSPGIRPPDSPVDDQKRALTPSQARDAGADILVVGRPILQAQDPVAAARNILRSLVPSPTPQPAEELAHADAR